MLAGEDTAAQRSVAQFKLSRTLLAGTQGRNSLLFSGGKGF